MAEAPMKPAASAPRRGRYVIVVIALGWLALVITLAPPQLAPVRCDHDRAVGPDTLVMLSASWCGYCRRAREFLQSSNIEHCEYDVETSAVGRAQYAALPVQLVPVIKLRGDELYGFNKTEIMQSLVAHGLADFSEDL